MGKAEGRIGGLRLLDPIAVVHQATKVLADAEPENMHRRVDDVSRRSGVHLVVEPITPVWRDGPVVHVATVGTREAKVRAAVVFFLGGPNQRVDDLHARLARDPGAAWEPVGSELVDLVPPVKPGGRGFPGVRLLVHNDRVARRGAGHLNSWQVA